MEVGGDPLIAAFYLTTSTQKQLYPKKLNKNTITKKTPLIPGAKLRKLIKWVATNARMMN